MTIEQLTEHYAKLVEIGMLDGQKANEMLKEEITKDEDEPTEH